MRRQDREIKDLCKIKAVIETCRVMRLAINTGGAPYIVPLNFGCLYEEDTLSLCFHCANEGKKLMLLKENPEAGFEMDCGHELIPGEIPCAYGYRYKSIIGEGRVLVVSDIEEKKKLLQALMRHQTNKEVEFTDDQVMAVAVCKLDVKNLTAKEAGY